MELWGYGVMGLWSYGVFFRGSSLGVFLWGSMSENFGVRTTPTRNLAKITGWSKIYE
jgi:hypothetical protein